jgi:hypothetical protein
MSLEPTTWEFTANTSGELAKVRKSLPERAKATVAGELFQMSRLLESLARTSLIEYPFKARHTGEKSVPDFQLNSGAHRIAVEITKIAVSDVEHARALQQKGLNRTLAISSLYRKASRPRRKEEVIAEGFGTPTFVFPVSLDEHDRIWLETAESSLTAKSDAIARPDFQRGEENWLLLWDRIGTADWELDKRKSALKILLARHWKPGWFSRVFLQEDYFLWQLMFTPSESRQLPSYRSKT